MAKTKPRKDRPKKKAAKPNKAAKPARPKSPPVKKAAKPAPAPKPQPPAEKPAKHPKGKGDAKVAPAAAPAPAPAGKPAKGPEKKSRKASRRPTMIRRGPDGEILAPGDLLLPGGAQRAEEIQYLFRGWAAAEHPSADEDAIGEVFARRPAGEFPSDRDEMAKVLAWARERFRGSIEPLVPQRAKVQRTFQGVVERARHRRREIGAFLRGLDIGHTETGHMDAHGEASLQGLMEWAARLENLAEADEPAQADYAQFHRGLDQLESTTEALIIDVEQTLRRLRDRLRS
jgi:hypothetical protein